MESRSAPVLVDTEHFAEHSLENGGAGGANDHLPCRLGRGERDLRQILQGLQSKQKWKRIVLLGLISRWSIHDDWIVQERELFCGVKDQAQAKKFWELNEEMVKLQSTDPKI